jgi:hypothetical protein
MPSSLEEAEHFIGHFDDYAATIRQPDLRLSSDPFDLSLSTNLGTSSAKDPSRLSARSFTSDNNNKARNPTSVAVTRSALIEYPLRLSNEKGFQTVKGQRMSLDSRFPLIFGPVLGNGRGNWSGSIGASSVAKGSTGFLTGTLAGRYQFSNNLGFVESGISTVGDHKEIKIGGSTDIGFSKSTFSSIDISTPMNQQPTCKADVSISRKLSESYTLKGTVSLDQRLCSSAAVSTGVTINAHTQHPWRLSAGWSKTCFPFLSFSVSPRTSAKRSFNLSTRWSGGSGLNVGFSLSQKLQRAICISMGILRTFKGLTWTLVWSDADLTVRIPIILDAGHINPWFTTMEAFYAIVLSHALQETISRVFNELNGNQTTAGRDVKRGQTGMKSRAQAIQQQKLMESRAVARVRQETKENGLVIQKAIYYISGGDSFDVTVPMQFWVSESSIKLADVSKKNLLGFCPLEFPGQTEKEAVDEGCSTWLAGLWRRPREVTSTQKAQPRLLVKYIYRSEVYEISVNDDETLSLPHDNAEPLTKAGAK